MIAVRQCTDCRELSVPVLGIGHSDKCSTQKRDGNEWNTKELKQDNFVVARRLAARFNAAPTYERIRFWKVATEDDIRLFKIGELLLKEPEAYAAYLAEFPVSDPRD